MKKTIKVWHLEVIDPDRVPGRPANAPYSLEKVEVPLPELSRFLYLAVGGPWRWYMRLDWTWQQWRDWLSREQIETWIAYQGVTPIGYFELEKQPRDTAEMLYFGLLPEFIGRGLGKQLLADAMARAWELAGRRIWLHTCSLDHPRALDNYLARGFSIFKEEQVTDNVPHTPIQPWEKAGKPIPDPLTH